jgi:flagellar hook-basal body complex protein FliE
MTHLSKASGLTSIADAWLNEADSLKGGAKADGGAFESLLAGELGKVFGAAQEVEAAVAAYNVGGDEASVERAAFLMAKSEADLRFAVQARNKAVNAYQDIINLQI